MASGDTKTEALLNILGNGGTGDEYRGSGNTKTQNYILDAIDRINAIEPGSGGSSVEYVDLAITGLNQDGSINVLAAKKNSEVISLAQNNIKVIFRMTIPSGAGVPMGSGTYELPLFNYDQPYYVIAMSVISLSGTLMSINFYYDSNNDTQNGVVYVSAT